MSLVKRLINAGKKGLISVALISSLSFLSCGGGNKVTSPNGNNGGNGGEPSATPYIVALAPTAEEPNRGMLLIIDGRFDDRDGLNIERKNENDYQFNLIERITQNSTNYEIHDGDINYVDLNNIGTSIEYSYRVQAYNEHGSSDYSNVRTAISVGPVLGIPQFLNPVADAHVKRADPNRNFGDENYITVAGENPGFYGGSNENALLLFSLPNLPSYAQFESAELRMCEAGGGHTFYPGLIGIYAAPIESFYSWDENTVTWNNRPGSYLSTYGYGMHNPNEERCLFIDVTKVVSDWYYGIRPNKGFMLFTGSDAYCSYYSRESSGSPSLLEINYVW